MGTWEARARAEGRAAVVADGCGGCRLRRAVLAAWIRLIGDLFKELVAGTPSTPPGSDPGVGAQGPPVTTPQVPMRCWRGAGWSQPVGITTQRSCSRPCVCGPDSPSPTPRKVSFSEYVPCNTSNSVEDSRRQAQASVPAPRALRAGTARAALLSPSRLSSSSCPLVKVPGLPRAAPEVRAVSVRKTLAFTLALRSGE